MYEGFVCDIKKMAMLMVFSLLCLPLTLQSLERYLIIVMLDIFRPPAALFLFFNFFSFSLQPLPRSTPYQLSLESPGQLSDGFSAFTFNPPHYCLLEAPAPPRREPCDGRSPRTWCHVSVELTWLFIVCPCLFFLCTSFYSSTQNIMSLLSLRLLFPLPGMPTLCYEMDKLQAILPGWRTSSCNKIFSES